MIDFKVELSADLTIATMSVDRWSLQCATAALPAWLKIYRGFVKKRPQTEKIYRPAITAIADAMTRLGMDTSDSAERKAKR